jgi:hypothetical protein
MVRPRTKGSGPPATTQPMEKHMNVIKSLLGWTAVGVVALGLTACGQDGISKQEIDSIKNSPKMTEKDWQRVGDGMKEGADARRNSQADWAKKNPAEVARVNAERAKAGKPPLGG